MFHWFFIQRIVTSEGQQFIIWEISDKNFHNGMTRKWKSMYMSSIKRLENENLSLQWNDQKMKVCILNRTIGKWKSVPSMENEVLKNVSIPNCLTQKVYFKVF